MYPQTRHTGYIHGSSSVYMYPQARTHWLYTWFIICVHVPTGQAHWLIYMVHHLCTCTHRPGTLANIHGSSSVYMYSQARHTGYIHGSSSVYMYPQARHAG